MPKLTIGMVKMLHEANGGPFFKNSKAHGDSPSKWKVVESRGRVFLEWKKIPLGGSSPRYEFFPKTGRIVFDSYILN